MADHQSVNGNLLHRVQDLLRRNPNVYDVVFSVGPSKKEVKAVRILLKAASFVLEKKFELWEDSMVRKGSGEGIPLPDFDPQAFEIFVKLTMLDDWTAHALEELNMMPDQILNLIAICSAFGMGNAFNHLENLMKSFYGEFADFCKTEEFLQISYSNLLTILSSENLPLNELEVFDCACRWAKAECAKRQIDASAENLRLVLGDIVFQIRFPLMTANEFNECVQQHDILTPAEGYEVFKFISNNDSQTFNSDLSQFPFKIRERGTTAKSTLKIEAKSEFSTLCLKMEYPIVDSPPFVCNEEEKGNFFSSEQKILVHGLGFLGPVDRDASYDVTVRFRQWEFGDCFDMGKLEKRISAQKGKVFHIMFDQPITMEAISMNEWTTDAKYYEINYALKGPNTQSFQRTFGTKGECTKLEGQNEFRLEWCSDQLAEILYSNM